MGIRNVSWQLLVALVCSLGLLGNQSALSQNNVAEPVGFVTLTIPGGSPESKSTIGFTLVDLPRRSTVTSVDGVDVRVFGGIPGGAYAEGGVFSIVSGSTLGLTLEIVGRSEAGASLNGWQPVEGTAQPVPTPDPPPSPTHEQVRQALPQVDEFFVRLRIVFSP